MSSMLHRVLGGWCKVLERTTWSTNWQLVHVSFYNNQYPYTSVCKYGVHQKKSFQQQWQVITISSGGTRQPQASNLPCMQHFPCFIHLFIRWKPAWDALLSTHHWLAWLYLCSNHPWAQLLQYLKKKYTGWCVESLVFSCRTIQIPITSEDIFQHNIKKKLRT